MNYYVYCDKKQNTCNIGFVDADTKKEFLTNDYELKYFESLEDSYEFALSNEDFEITADQNLTETEYGQLLALSDDEISRKPFDSGKVASLCSCIEDFGVNKNKKTADDIKRLSEEIFRFETFAYYKALASFIDSVKGVETALLEETKEILRFIESIGMDMFDQERERKLTA